MFPRLGFTVLLIALMAPITAEQTDRITLADGTVIVGDYSRDEGVILVTTDLGVARRRVDPDAVTSSERVDRPVLVISKTAKREPSADTAPASDPMAKQAADFPGLIKKSDDAGETGRVWVDPGAWRILNRDQKIALAKEAATESKNDSGLCVVLSYLDDWELAWAGKSGAAGIGPLPNVPKAGPAGGFSAPR